MSKSNPLRMYLFMRNDLGDVPVGKLLGQSGHAFAHCLLAAARRDPELARAYDKDPEHTKIVLGVTKAQIDEVMDKAIAANLVTHAQLDLAKTVFDGVTWTCVAVGPLPHADAERILETKKYKLY